MPRVDVTAGAVTHLDKYLKGAGQHQRSPDGYQRLTDVKPKAHEEPDDGQ